MALQPLESEPNPFSCDIYGHLPNSEMLRMYPGLCDSSPSGQVEGSAQISGLMQVGLTLKGNTRYQRSGSIVRHVAINNVKPRWGVDRLQPPPELRRVNRVDSGGELEVPVWGLLANTGRHLALGSCCFCSGQSEARGALHFLSFQPPHCSLWPDVSRVVMAA